MEEQIDYARFDYYRHAHFLRYRRRVQSMDKKLTCQECGGSGGEVFAVLDYGEGPWEQCGFCEGTGLVTPYMRGLWLKYKREQAIL